MYTKKNKFGFTFIEILVVVTIIGVLASLGMISYSQFVKQSRDAKRKGDVEQIRAAVEMYKSKNNTYPLTGEVVVGSSLCDPAPGGCGQGTYIQKIPADPKSTTYTYYYSSSGTDYILGAYFEQASTSSCGNCSLGPAVTCNYCMGPYGQL